MLLQPLFPKTQASLGIASAAYGQQQIHTASSSRDSGQNCVVCTVLVGTTLDLVGIILDLINIIIGRIGVVALESKLCQY